MELGRLGVWVGMDGMSAPTAAAFAKRVEDRGYGALWIPEGRGRNALVLSSWLLCHTKRLIVATGIANIYAHDPVAMAGGQRALAEQSNGRFLLGVGVSHRPTVEGACEATPMGSLCRRCAPTCRQCGKRRMARPSLLLGR
jgi:alkanesulfonate monooxygenase SsuD/methylene tetrahydromethanopterin reductase-like flavin-dependent oxidoreductase (luciferase family)